MIKRIIFILIFFSLYLCSIAQFSIGLEGGAAISFTKTHIETIYKNTQSFDKSHPLWITPIGGLMVNVFFNKRFSLQSEILYENEGYGGYNRNYPLGYIYFPEMIRYKIPLNTASDMSFFIEAGAYFSYCCYYSNINFLFSGSHNISRTDIGMITGLGYKQEWGIGQIEFCLKFEHNFIGQNTTSYLNEGEISNTAFYNILSLTVGYSLQVETIKKLLHSVKHEKKK
ncbi:MAG: outer membrane beta-barrel protein [Bacteroidota bacterium]